MTPIKSIKKICFQCMGDNAKAISGCHLVKCPLWNFRLGKKTGNISSTKSIKAYCLECSTFNKAEVRNCDISDCVFYPFRMGKNPNITHRKGNAEALLKYRLSVKTQQI